MIVLPNMVVIPETIYGRRRDTIMDKVGDLLADFLERYGDMMSEEITDRLVERGVSDLVTAINDIIIRTLPDGSMATTYNNAYEA